jgi:N-acetylneuraminic acid mutarotase
VFVYDIQTNVWTTAAGALTTARSDHCAVYANSKLYVIGGWDGGWSNVLDSVEVSSDAGATWTTTTSLPADGGFAGKRGDLACAVSGTKIYVFGGYYDNVAGTHNYWSTVYEGDAAASPSLTWTVKKPMPTARGDMAAVTLSDGSILVMGGEQIYPGDVTKTKIAMHEVERYFPTVNAWVSKAPMPLGRFRFAAAADYNDHVHVLGGHQTCHDDDGSGSVCSSADYQFTADQAHYAYYDVPHSSVAGNPHGVSPQLSDNVAIYYNYNIYLIGGLDSTSGTGTAKAEVHIYNTLTKVWSTGASLPAVRNRYGAALMDGKIYVMGGRGAADAVASTTYIYNIAANTWSTGGALKTARSDHCAAAANGKLYVVGGWTGAYSTLKSVEVSTNNGASWSLTTDIPEERGDVSCAASGNKVFVIGGYYDYTGAWLANSFHDDVFALDATNTEDSWYNVSSMKYARGDKAVTTLSDGSILVMGGETYYSSSASKVAMHHVERYYPIHDTWVEKAPMPRGRFRFAAAADYNDHVHVLGGHRSCHLDDGYGSVCSSADYQFEAHDAHDVFYDIDHPDLWLITRDPQIAATATV